MSNELDKNTFVIKRNLQVEDIDKKTLVIREINEKNQQIICEQIIKYNKLKDKVILSRLSVRELKNLIKRCEEVIKDKESEEK